MPRLQLVRPDHASALLAFERRNRDYFAASIPDRGDEYFTDFEARHRQLLDWQAEGSDFFHVLADDDGEILGRVNLVKVTDGEAELGYRIAESAAGRGLATDGVRQVCALAVTAYGLSGLRAVTTLDNVASQVVLTRTGFLPVADITLSGRPGRGYRLDLDGR